jgi:hypothetical protein
VLNNKKLSEEVDRHRTVRGDKENHGSGKYRDGQVGRNAAGNKFRGWEDDDDGCWDSQLCSTYSVRILKDLMFCFGWVSASCTSAIAEISRQ